jgi:hypothetical protein
MMKMGSGLDGIGTLTSIPMWPFDLFFNAFHQEFQPFGFAGLCTNNSKPFLGWGRKKIKFKFKNKKIVCLLIL